MKMPMVPAGRAGPVHMIFQEELLRGLDPVPGVNSSGAAALVFSTSGNWRAELDRLDAELSPESPLDPMSGTRVAVFGSLEVAAYVRRNCGHLATGILQDEDHLSVQTFSGLMPREWLLNRETILLPFGQAASREDQLRALFGERLFMRPASSRKDFSGTVFEISDLAQELSAQRQLHNLYGDTLVAFDRAQAIAPHEYRFWLMNGEVVTCAAYSFEAGAPAPPCPQAVHSLASKVAEHVEVWADPVVADFVMDEGGVPRLVELNGFTSSGFYPGADFAAIARGLDRLLL